MSGVGGQLSRRLDYDGTVFVNITAQGSVFVQVSRIASHGSVSLASDRREEDVRFEQGRSGCRIMEVSFRGDRTKTAFVKLTSLGSVVVQISHITSQRGASFVHVVSGLQMQVMGVHVLCFPRPPRLRLVFSWFSPAVELHAKESAPVLEVLDYAFVQHPQTLSPSTGLRPRTER